MYAKYGTELEIWWVPTLYQSPVLGMYEPWRRRGFDTAWISSDAGIFECLYFATQ